jgi:GNAT superfamily N-acetyltransferase
VLFRIDDDERLVGVNEPEGGPAPRLFLARSRTSTLIWFRADVSPAAMAACRAIAADLPSWGGRQPTTSVYGPLREALASDQPMTTEVSGPAHQFGEHVDGGLGVETSVIDEASAHLLERFFPYTRSVLAARRPVLAVVVDVWAVSACFAARRRTHAAEAGVATEEMYRGRGFGVAVVAAWREAVERQGAQPLYSSSWENRASLALAERLRLLPYAETLDLT